MRTNLALLLSIALFVVPATASGQDAEAAVKAGGQAWQEAYNAGDAAALAALYAEDAVVLAPGSEPVEGREAIRAFWQASMDENPGATDQITTEEILDMGGGVAVERGAYVATGADGEHLDHGKYVVVWKQTDDGWKLYRDIFNSSM